MSGKDSGGQRTLSYSVMRVLACFAIVVLHIVNVSEILQRETISPMMDRISMTIVYCLMWAAPLFVCVSGALLLDPEKQLPVKKIMTRYIPRIFGALALFVFVFRFFDLVMNREAFSLAVIGDALYKLFTKGSWSHLWYLYVLIGLYLMLPFYRMITEKAKPGEILYLLGLYAFFLSVIKLGRLFGLTIGFSIDAAEIYPLYFFLGYAISKGILKLPKPVAAIGLVLATAGIIGISLMQTGAESGTVISELGTFLGSYSSPLVVLQTSCVFALLWSPEKGKVPEWLEKVIVFIDGNGFGIYLIHLIFVRLLLRYWNVDLYRYGLWAFAAASVGIFAVSCLLTWVLRQIPGIKKIL